VLSPFGLGTRSGIACIASTSKKVRSAFSNIRQTHLLGMDNPNRVPTFRRMKKTLAAVLLVAVLPSCAAHVDAVSPSPIVVCTWDNGSRTFELFSDYTACFPLSGNVCDPVPCGDGVSPPSCAINTDGVTVYYEGSTMQLSAAQDYLPLAGTVTCK
jgi:hypothetical protein